MELELPSRPVHIIALGGLLGRDASFRQKGFRGRFGAEPAVECRINQILMPEFPSKASPHRSLIQGAQFIPYFGRYRRAEGGMSPVPKNLE
jgi:hypothetical protein